MSNWIDVQGYDVAVIDKRPVVLVRGGGYYESGITTPAWRVFCTCADLYDARRVAHALNDTLNPPVPEGENDEY